VANTFGKKQYSASLIGKDGLILAKANSKPALSLKLLKTVKDLL
jgi:hypothetical protein